MSYYFSKIINKDFKGSVEKVTAELKKEGFGILSEIDVKQTLKKKLNVDYPEYKILGACNPPFAYQSLQAEDKIGTMLPCNVIVRDIGQGRTEVSAVDPVASMKSVENPSLSEIASEIRSKLKKVIDSL